MDADNDVVARLHDKLTDALRQTRRQPGAPVTVAEIYQELVPYRLVRSEVGFGMNADYEHVLLRLLAGEGEFARLEPVSARDAIRTELRGPNPNVGMYREFAGCDVWVRTDDNAADVISGVAKFAMVDDVDDDGDDGVDNEVEVPDMDAGGAMDTVQESATSAQAVRVACAYCDSSLPGHRPVRFCPYCGADQTTQPCVACGESLEPGWTYCIACGTSRSDAG